MTGNAKIQMKAEAPNTIQYLPSNPTSHPNDPVNGFIDFNDGKPTGKIGPFGGMNDNMPPNMNGPSMGMNGSGMPPQGMNGSGMPPQSSLTHRQQMDIQIMNENNLQQQMRAERALGAMHGPRGPIPGGPHMHGGTMLRPSSPMMMPHGSASPGLGSGSPMLGPGVHMNEMMHMHSQPRMGPNGMHEMSMGMGGMMGPHGGDMQMSRRGGMQMMHPDGMMGPGRFPHAYGSWNDGARLHATGDGDDGWKGWHDGTSWNEARADAGTSAEQQI